MFITGSNPLLVDIIIHQLDSTFSTKDLGLLSDFCGVEVLATSSGLLLSQQKYVIDLLSKHNMLGVECISYHDYHPIFVCILMFLMMIISDLMYKFPILVIRSTLEKN